ncbi:MAG: hypothetical protein ACYC23_25115, partial [Limisphaerales bacterium]
MTFFYLLPGHLLAAIAATTTPLAVEISEPRGRPIGCFIPHPEFVCIPSLRLPAWGLAFIHPSK